MSFAATLSWAGRLAACVVLAATGVAGAQQVYRIVGPDGRVTFSDKPPTEPAARATPAAVSAGAGSAATAGLPFELRQVASRYPVTLYSGPECGPCGSGRAFLQSRGIPYAEKTVSTAEDAEALQRLLGGAPALPVLTIGAQQLKGFSDAEWTQFLDAAGYPKTSQLPASYRPAPATPLVVAAQPPGVVTQPAQAAAPRSAPTPSAGPALPPGNNPAGITF